MGKYQLKISLLEGWSDYSHENPDGPLTFLRDYSEVPGPLQVSYAIYEGGDDPKFDKNALIELCREFGRNADFGELKKTACMTCVFGIMGTAVFRSQEFPRSQVWQLSNGQDLITVTHLCPETPEAKEVQEVQEIVKNISLASKKARWEFW